MGAAFACGCQTGVGRRGFMGILSGGAALALLPSAVRAQGPAPSPYKAMLLSCVDPRTQTPVAAWMARPEPESHAVGLEGKYSQFTIAGAAVGVTAPAFPAAWSETFWGNFDASLKLHRIRSLVVVDHSNCGAVGIAYGEDVLKDPRRELAVHVQDTRALQAELARRHPEIGYQAWYLSRDDDGRFTRWQSLIAGPVIG